jgi:hypothetical protein
LSSNIITNSDYAINLNSGANTLSLTGVFSATGNIAGNFFIGNGSQLTGIAASYGNSNVVANLAALGTNPVSTTGNITSSFFIGNGSQLTGLAATYGNSNVVANLAALGTNPVSTTGNITGGNLLFGSGLVSGTGTVSTTTLSVTGAVTFSGTTTNQSIGTSQSTGTLTLGAVAQTGAINIGRSLANQTIAIGNGATISDRIKTIDIGTLGAANSTTNINIGPVAGNSTVQFLGNAQVAIANTGGSALSVAGNITGGNLTVSGIGNIGYGQVGEVLKLSNSASAADKWLTVKNLYGDFQIGTQGNIGAYLYNGATSPLDFYTSASKRLSIANTGETQILSTTTSTSNSIGALVVSGGVGVAGNIYSGGLISATGNITGGNVLGGANVNATTHTGTTVSVTANITGGNLQTAGLISATGNITGNNLTAGTITLSGNTISSTDSIITIDPASVGNTGGVIIQGNLSVTGNVTYIDSNTITTNDLVINMANNAATAAAANGGGIGVGPVTGAYATITYNSTSNIWVISNGANISGAVSASGNITGGNLLTGGLISATGNVTGGNVLGGANVNATTHTGTTVSVSANVTGGNILTGGLISATGNITGGNVLGGANVNATTHTGTTVSVSANITGGNILTAGLISATSTITGNQLITTGTLGISFQGNSQNGTYNQTLLYDNQNNTSASATNGLFLERGRLTDSAAAEVRYFVIGARGGQQQWAVNGTGDTTQTGQLTATNIYSNAVVSATGNIFGGNLTIAGNTATITTAGYSIGYLNVPQVSLAANATTALTDSGKHYYSTSASNLTLTIADNSAVSWPVGTSFIVVNRGTGNINVAPAAGVSLYLAGNSTSANRVLTTYNLATCLNLAANVWMISGSGLV